MGNKVEKHDRGRPGAPDPRIVPSGVVCKNENGSARPNLNRRALPFLIFFRFSAKIRLADEP
jgi:hypothetical protein